MTRTVNKSRPSTFSIVACDPNNGDLGIAVQSKFLAVGSVVPWAQAGVGAVATQSFANTTYGPEGLRLMAAGSTAPEALEQLLDKDSEAAQRQVSMVDAAGQATSFTGKGCHHWAGHIIGEGYACAGNILVGEDTVRAMATTFENTEGSLSMRLVTALAAGQSAGGDSRGQQSAAVLVVRAGGGYGGWNDRFIDLRVDDHPEPITELRRLLDLHWLYLTQSSPADLIPISPDIARELQTIVQKTGYFKGEISSIYDEATRAALWNLYAVENLEERWHDTLVDVVALAFLRRRFGEK